ncbi:MAG TPA: right-handed parallel beta-helix repeat-containing protein [Acidobacteriaceae bacterium]|nr:right-handed parallel beta-helix repeat-containing protein [Acidobacteriaceae bacterium]
MVLLAALWAGQQVHAASFYVDCTQSTPGDGSQEHPWNQIGPVSAQMFHPGDLIALRRGTVCHGALTLHGSGRAEARIRLTAWGEGARPQIIADKNDTQALLLKNAESWQIDSLDIAGGNTYGLLVTGDQDQVLSHITLRNLVVHDVFGGELHNKDNGLVVFLRGSKRQRFDHVLIENVVAAHTNQWAGIMMGAGNFYSDEEGYNRDVTIRNSVAHDVYGDGIILFRVRGGLIDASTAWLTGQQPTEKIGTPNAIWTWSCTDCIVRNSESFLTESPGVDGGAYDIDWATTRNTVENNYAHDTQGYCVAVFGAGYVTHDAVVRHNVCVDNGLSPRMARLQGAIYIHTWNDGKIDGMIIDNNRIDWNPPAPAAPIVNDEGTELAGNPVTVRDNTIRSTSPLLVRSVGDRLVFAHNIYMYAGLDKPSWFWNGKTWDSLAALQAAGGEKGSTLQADLEQSLSGTVARLANLPNLADLDGRAVPTQSASQYRLLLPIDLQLDADGLIPPEVMTRLSVLRTLTREYNARQLQVLVFVSATGTNPSLRNALIDLDAPSIRFVRAESATVPVALVDAKGRIVEQWSGSDRFNAATVGYAVRRRLGVPVYAQMDARP